MKTTNPQARARHALYRHIKRPRWGLAVLAWDHLDKRGYQFEDGKLRVFNSDFYRLLEEVDPPADRARQVLEQLGHAVERNEAVKSSKEDVLIPIAEQIAYFKELYPDGFAGDAWTSKMRGRAAKTALKRHRDPVVKRARERLASERLERLIDAQKYDGVIESLIDVLVQTDLVSASKLKPLRSVPHRHQEALAIALQGLLNSDGAFASRFDDFVRSIGEPDWELATAPLTLVDPERHVCIKSIVFKQQALWMAPQLEHARLPTARTYQRYQQMAQAVFEQLVEAGLNPRDLLDVHDFIYLTLRPSVRKLLIERSRERNARDASARSPNRDAA